MTSLSLRNVPIFSPVDSTSESPDPPTPKFKVDLEVWVNYLPTESPPSVSSPSPNVPTPASSSNSDHPDVYVREFLRRLPVLESIAVCYLRHQFLHAWKTTIHDTPRACFDVYPLTIPSARVAAGTVLFVDFLDWLQTYFCTRMLSKLPAGLINKKSNLVESHSEHGGDVKME